MLLKRINFMTDLWQEATTVVQLVPCWCTISPGIYL